MSGRRKGHRMIQRYFKFNPAKALFNFAVTMIFCGLISLFLIVTKISEAIGPTFVITYSIGSCSHIIITALLFTIKPSGRATILGCIVLGAVLGNILGMHLGAFLSAALLGQPVGFRNPDYVQMAAIGLAFAAAISFFFWSRGILSASKAQIQEERIRRISSEKATLEANLRLLQAQIEPHFLFNTLSNIHSLMDIHPQTAKAMLLDLNQYLRNTLAHTREEETTLGRELGVVAAYLKIFKIRMGERLDYRIDLPETLASTPFPPMLLQPLVENAIIHGIEPSESGGRIDIRARKNNGLLRVEISDTGNGVCDGTGSGVGIANVRERLELLFGPAATLRLSENQPRGISAVIEIAYENENENTDCRR
jgi:hypothetical protein